jgi:hypothetical protein
MLLPQRVNDIIIVALLVDGVAHVAEALRL